ncbi:5-hydroxymethyl-dUMP N-hydrolase isoform X1 [Ambystoma mexicanum]|uniref:5-hydroxymethyl-dUMP N-hydrolase isoform X1 n=1 Tax=Ambystoma mexicanum TaxID=8296 RepID=UPI0037E8D965
MPLPYLAMAGLQVYFCGSIRGGRQDRDLYARIVDKLREYGRVLTEHVASEGCSERVIRFRADDQSTANPRSTREDAIRDGDKFIHDRDVQWLELTDVVIAEVTQPSLGVGYELGRAVAMKKKVLCLFRPSSGRCLSAMVRGAEDGKRFFVKDYQEEDIEKLLEEYFRTTFPGSLVMQPGKDAC